MNCYFINAFTDQLFGGNPAAVIPLQEWLPSAEMQQLAAENRVSETAFFIPAPDGFHLRWFTPEIEMDLCGHATLASAFVIKNYLNWTPDEIVFHSNSGKLTVSTGKDQFLTLNFPSRIPTPATLPTEIEESLNYQPQAVLKSRDYVLIYDSEEIVRNIQPDRRIMDRINIDPGGVIATAPGDEVDFVSRFFTPQSSIFEDPVTGSAHCSLIPYWSARLNKKLLQARQISARGGTLHCTDAGDRVLIAGECRPYLSGEIFYFSRSS